jgi:hypothetical protein
VEIGCETRPENSRKGMTDMHISQVRNEIVAMRKTVGAGAIEGRQEGD